MELPPLFLETLSTTYTPFSHTHPSRILIVPKMAQRVTLRTRKSYNTKSNRRRIVKTPCA